MEGLQYCPSTVLLDTVKETLNPAEPCLRQPGPTEVRTSAVNKNFCRMILGFDLSVRLNKSPSVL